MFRSYRWMALGAALFGVSVFAMQGCTVTTNDGTGSTGEPPPAPTGCLDCVYQQCAGQYSSCVSDQDCYATYGCAIACPSGDDNCLNNCIDQRPAGKNKYLALATCDTYAGCSSSACTSYCQGSGDVACTPGQVYDPGSTQTCQQCTDNSCSSQKANCYAGTDCDLYSTCTLPCADDTDPSACIEICNQAHPTGAQASTDLSTCTTSNCASPCGF